MQQKRPVAYFSKALSGANLLKSTYERELTAVALAVQHWRHYLLGRKFTIFTDQKSLRHLMEQQIATSTQQDWMAKLMGFQFDVVYKAGVENKVADALSRQQGDLQLMTIASFPIWQQGRDVHKEVLHDPILKQILEDLGNDPHSS